MNKFTKVWEITEEVVPESSTKVSDVTAKIRENNDVVIKSKDDERRDNIDRLDKTRESIFTLIMYH